MNNKTFLMKSFIGCLYELNGEDHQELIYQILKEGEDSWEILWRLREITHRLEMSYAYRKSNLDCNDE